MHQCSTVIKSPFISNLTSWSQQGHFIRNISQKKWYFYSLYFQIHMYMNKNQLLLKHTRTILTITFLKQKCTSAELGEWRQWQQNGKPTRSSLQCGTRTYTQSGGLSRSHFWIEVPFPWPTLVHETQLLSPKAKLPVAHLPHIVYKPHPRTFKNTLLIHKKKKKSHKRPDNSMQIIVVRATTAELLCYFFQHSCSLANRWTINVNTHTLYNYRYLYSSSSIIKKVCVCVWSSVG